MAKQNSVSDLVSKALTDKNISDSEFSIILREIQKYHKLKSDIRSAKNKQSNQPQPDIEEISKQIRREERQNRQKNLVFDRRVEVGFERVNTGFKLWLTKWRMLNYK